MTENMTPMLVVHIVGGSIAAIAGYGALLAPKGRPFHRAAGRTFVGGMLVMALGAMVVAVQRGRTGQVVSAAFVVYLVGTAVTTFLPDSARVRRLNTALRIVALPLAAAFVVGGVARLTIATESHGGVPAQSIAAASFVNALVMVLGWWGDVRVSRGGAPSGPARVRRHLWRMCFATFVASGSFFLGQADAIPEPLRIQPVLTTLAFLPLLLMLGYLWRHRDRRRRAVAPPATGIRLRDGALAAVDIP